MTSARDGKTYVGTTDTVYTGDLTNPTITQEDRDYVVAASQYMFPELKLTADDVESAWSGIRPLINQEGKKPSEISRKDEIWKSSTGLYTIAGGKLTGYRKMAQNIMDKIQSELESTNGRKYKGCQTKNLRLSGGNFDDMDRLVQKAKSIGVFQELAIDEKDIAVLVKQFGSNIETLQAVAENMSLSDKIPASIQLIVDYGIDYEMVLRPVDFFIRRTGALLFNRSWVTEWKEPVIEYMAEKLNWSEQEVRMYWEELDSRLQEVEAK